MKKKILFSFAAAVIVSGCSTTGELKTECKTNTVVLSAEQEKQLEKSPILKADEIVPAILLKGANYQVDPVVMTDGFLMQFKIKSDFGDFEASSPATLNDRIFEISALAQLEKISKTEAFIKGMKHSLVEFGIDVKDLVTSPIDSITGIPAGIGRFFQRTYLTTTTGLDRLGNSGGDNDLCGSGKALPGKNKSYVKNDSNAVMATANATGKVAINLLGYFDQRRLLAKKLQVDPYTTNAALAQALDDTAWASFAGGLGITALKMAAPATMAINMTSRISSWVWDMPPGEMRVFNEKTLLAMGVSQEKTDHLLSHRMYTLTLQGRLVRALNRFPKSSGQEQVMDLALTVESHLQAQFIVESVEVLANYHASKQFITKIEAAETVAGYTKAGGVVVPAPVSYLSWNKRLNIFSVKNTFKGKKKTILLTGQITSRAKKELEGFGWVVSQ